MNTPQRTIEFKTCLGITEFKKFNRAVYHEVPKPPEKNEAPKAAEAPAEWNKINAEAKFNPDDSDEVFKELAQKAHRNESYATEIRTALEGLLPKKFEKLGNGDKIKGLWSMLSKNDLEGEVDEDGNKLDNKCTNVSIEDGILKFRDGRGREIVFRKDSIAIPISIVKPSTGSDASNKSSARPLESKQNNPTDTTTENSNSKPAAGLQTAPGNKPTNTEKSGGNDQIKPQEKAAQAKVEVAQANPKFAKEYREIKAKGDLAYQKEQRRILNNFTSYQGDKVNFYHGNSEVTDLAKAGEAEWNKAWDGNQFKNIDRVKYIWRSFFPERNTNELRDILFQTYEKTTKNGALNADEFIKIAKIHFVKDAYNESVPGTLADLNDYETVRNGVVFMLESMSKLALTGEIAPNRPQLKWTNADARVNEIFTYNETNGTMEDSKAKKVKTEILPWLFSDETSILEPQTGEKINIFDLESQDATAFAHTLEQTQGLDGKTDTKALTGKINYYLLQGIMALRVNVSSAHLTEILAKLNINAPQSNNDEAPFEAIFNKLSIVENSINNQNFGKSGDELAAFKYLVKLGYTIDSRMVGKISKTEIMLNTKEVNPEKLSNIQVVRQAQLEAIKRGYPGTMEEIETRIRQQSKTIAAVLVQRNPDGSTTVGAGAAILDLGYDFTLGVGASITTEGTGNFMVGIAKGDMEKGMLSLGLGINTHGQPDLGVGGAINFVKVPIGKSSFDFLVSGGVGASVQTGLNAFVGVGVSWDPNRDMDKEYMAEVGKKGLDQIEAAFQRNDVVAVAQMMRQHPSLGRSVDLFATQYQLNDQDVFNIYKQTRNDLQNLSVQQLNNPKLLGFLPITSVGAGVVANIGAGGVNIGPGFLLTVEAAKTTYVVTREEETPQNMRDRADANLTQWARSKGYKLVEANAPLTVKETDAKFARTLDGKLAIGVEHPVNDLSYLDQTGSTLKEINEGLQGQGIQLEAVPNKPGLLRVVIDALDATRPINALRTTRVFIDPALKNQGLFLDGNQIYLATTSNPKLFLKRLDYTTPKNQDGVPAHTDVILSNNPERTLEEVTARESRKYIICLPGGAMEVRSTGQNVEQNNVMSFAQYEAFQQQNPNYAKNFESYSETSFAGHKQAALDRFNSLPKLGDTVRENLDNFVQEFYAKHRIEFKRLTTTPTANFEVLSKLIQREFKQPKPLNIDELNVVIYKLTQKSFASTEGKPDAVREKLAAERRAWAKSVLTPIWEKRIIALKAKGVSFQRTAKQLVDIAVDSTKGAFAKGESKLPEDSFSMTLAGTETSRPGGERSMINPETLLGVKNYEQDLGKPTPEGEIARLIMEGLTPLPEDNAQFMESPLALTLYRKLAMVLLVGKENFAKVTECFNKKTVTAENKKAFDEFRFYVKQIRDAEIAGKKELAFTIDNKTFKFLLHPIEVRTGVDKSCTNFSTYINENFDLQLPRDSATVAGVRAFERTTLRSEFDATHIGVGLGVTVMPTRNEKDLDFSIRTRNQTPNQSKEAGGVSVHAEGNAAQNTPEQPKTGSKQ